MPALGHSAMSGDNCDLHHLVAAIGNKWVEARDAVKILQVHMLAPTTKNYLAKNANSAIIEKLYCKV